LNVEGLSHVRKIILRKKYWKHDTWIACKNKIPNNESQIIDKLRKFSDTVNYRA